MIIDSALAAMQPDVSGCWNWPGYVAPNGYGHVPVRRKAQMAHRVVYERLVGPIPPGLDLDHLCRNRRCVNPDHLEPVTRSVNSERSPIHVGVVNRAKHHCPAGHPYDEANTYVGPGGRRTCRACNCIAVSNYRRRKKERSAA